MIAFGEGDALTVHTFIVRRTISRIITIDQTRTLVAHTDLPIWTSAIDTALDLTTRPINAPQWRLAIQV